MACGIKRKIDIAYKNVSKEIRGYAQRGGRYAGALSTEGYNGGYRAALDDVILALNGNKPSRNGWWEEN